MDTTQYSASLAAAGVEHDWAKKPGSGTASPAQREPVAVTMDGDAWDRSEAGGAAAAGDPAGAEDHTSVMRYIALAVIGWSLCSCGGSVQKIRNVSPDRSCEVWINDYYKSPVPLDPNGEIELHCRGFRTIKMLGRFDWYYRNSAVKWDMGAKRVKVVACGKVGPPIDVEFELSPPSLRSTNEYGIKLLATKEGRTYLPPPAKDGSDALLRATCYADFPSRWETVNTIR